MDGFTDFKEIAIQLEDCGFLRENSLAPSPEEPRFLDYPLFPPPWCGNQLQDSEKNAGDLHLPYFFTNRGFFLNPSSESAVGTQENALSIANGEPVHANRALGFAEQGIMATAMEKILNPNKIGEPEKIKINPLQSLDIEVIDETALIQSPSVLERDKGGRNENGSLLNDGGEKEKVSRRRRRRSKKNSRKTQSLQMRDVGEIDLGRKRNYSMAQLEMLRFKEKDSQGKLWNSVYSKLGPVVSKEYDELKGWVHRKSPAVDRKIVKEASSSSLPPPPPPSILGDAAASRWNNLKIYAH